MCHIDVNPLKICKIHNLLSLSVKTNFYTLKTVHLSNNNEKMQLFSSYWLFDCSVYENRGQEIAFCN